GASLGQGQAGAGDRGPAAGLPPQAGGDGRHPRAWALRRAGMSADADSREPPAKPRRTATHTRRARTGAVAVVAVASAVALPLLVVKASRTIANSKAGRTATTLAPSTASVPDTPA